MSEMVCVKDGRILRIAQNGVLAELLDDEGRPYKIYYSDKWQCPKCHFTLLVTAPNAVVEHFQSEYEGYKDRGLIVFQH